MIGAQDTEAEYSARQMSEGVGPTGLFPLRFIWDYLCIWPVNKM